MATWIVHLRVAEELYKYIEGLDPEQFFIGSIAPDSGIPDEKWETFDPPATLLHFQHPDETTKICGDLLFYRKYLNGLPNSFEENARFSFYCGYFFHLVVDGLWGAEVGERANDLYEKTFQGEFANKKDFFLEAKRDWYGLDFEYVRENPNSFFWQVFFDCEVHSSYLDFLPLEALKQRVEGIRKFYQREDEAVEKFLERPDQYLSKGEMDSFVEEATKTLLQIYQMIWVDKVDLGEYKTALRLL